MLELLAVDLLDVLAFAVIVVGRRPRNMLAGRLLTRDAKASSGGAPHARVTIEQIVELVRARSRRLTAAYRG